MNKEFLLYFNLFSCLYFVVLIYLMFRVSTKYKSYKVLVYAALTLLPALLHNFVSLKGWIDTIPVLFFITAISNSLFHFFIKKHLDLLLKGKWNAYHWVNILNYIFIFSIICSYGWFLSLDIFTQNDFLNSIGTKDFLIEFSILNGVFLFVQLCYVLVIGMTVFSKLQFINEPYFNLFIQRIIYARKFWFTIFILYLSIIISYFIFSQYIVEYLILPITISTVYLVILINAQKYANHYIFIGNSDEIPNPIKKESRNFSEEEMSIKMSFTELEEIESQIKKLILEDQIHLDRDITLEKLALMLNIQRYKLPLIIKNIYKVNFMSLINSYRILHAKGLLKKYDLCVDTIEGIGYESGFNSKASFYRAFKKYANITPTQYVSSQQAIE